MNTNNKVLELTFTVEGSRSMTLSIPCPKDDLTLETVKEKAALILPGAGILFRPCGHGFQAGEDRRNQCDRTGITRNGTVRCLTSHLSVLLFTTYDYHKGEHYGYHV